MYVKVRPTDPLPAYSLRGLGDAAPGFVDGLTAWTSPSGAVTALKNAVSDTDTLGDKVGYVAGLVAAPVGLLAVASMMLGGKRRRR